MTRKPAIKTRPRSDSAIGKVLARLERGPLCSQAFYFEEGLTHRIPARVNDLKSLYGFDIDDDPCRNPGHDHRAKGAVEYRLAKRGQGAFDLNEHTPREMPGPAVTSPYSGNHGGFE